MKRFFSFLPTAIILAVFCLFLASCGAPSVGDVGAIRQFFAMDTAMRLTVFGPQQEKAADAALAEVNRLEQLLSRTRPESQISLLNQRAGDPTPVGLDREVIALISASKGFSKETCGAFDITIAPVMDAWGFGQSGQEDAYRVPSNQKLESLLSLVDADKLTLTTEGGALAEVGMAVDLGAVAKGYAAGQLINLLKSFDVENALLELGGNITALGTHPDGAPWKIAVRDPQDESAYLCVLPLRDATASTSGGYERFFEAGGKTYHHIIDPATGRPADTGLLSVTVISPNAARDDALSTALFVLGPEKALDLWRRSEEKFELILVKTDDSVLITEGLEEGLAFKGEGYTYEIIRR